MPDNRAAVMLDETWLRSKLRMAMGIESRDGITGAEIRVIAPTAREARGNLFALGIEWPPLEERFTLYGSGIALIRSDTKQAPMTVAEP